MRKQNQETSVPAEERGVPAELADAARGVRLQKAMAQAGVASRRDCEQLVEAGHVRVNGQAVTALPAWVDPASDRIEVDGKPIARPRKTARRSSAHSYIMVHKPRRVISTTDDDAGRRTVLDLVHAWRAARLFPVGRLDAESTGLMLLTDDGELANRLTHPRYGVAKQYRVSVRGTISQEELGRLREGILLGPAGGEGGEGKQASAERVVILGREKDRQRGDRTILGITLREGQNREIRRMLARLGYKVSRLQRVAIGPLRLKGLAVGQSRHLTAGEMRGLYKAAGLRQK